MRRLIMNTPEHLVCDHRNHDGLDNRKRNCRNCTPAQNNANRRKTPAATSQYLGVSWDARRNKWTAHIKKQGTSRSLSAYDIKVEAACVYDLAAIVVHRPHPALNFPDEGTDLTRDK